MEKGCCADLTYPSGGETYNNIDTVVAAWYASTMGQPEKLRLIPVQELELCHSESDTILPKSGE